MKRFIVGTSLRWLLPAALVITALLGCSSSGAPGRASPGDEGSKSAAPTAPAEYSVKAFVERNGVRNLLKFAPAEMSTPVRAGAGAARASSSGNVGSSKAALTIQLPGEPLADLEDLVDRFPQFPPPEGYLSAWLLQFLVIMDCSGSYPETMLPNVATAYPWIPAAPPAPQQLFHVFDTEGIDSCDDVLVIQETLLCTANKLNTYANAVVDEKLKLGNLEITIPPQKERDKFILRDLAINVLAHVALADFALRSPTVSGASFDACTETYSQLLTPAWSSAVDGAFGGPNPSVTFPPEIPAATEADAKLLGKGRLNYKAHILRASGRLLKDLIDTSVRADMAGAESQRASAGSSAGAKLMWGVVGDGQSESAPYNSLRHAAKVLFGRLEQGLDVQALGQDAPVPPLSPFAAPVQDRACHGFHSLISAAGKAQFPDKNYRDIVDALGLGFPARWSDQPATTSGRALATSIVTNLGIVSRPGERTSGPDLDAIRNVVIKREAQKVGILDIDFDPAPGYTSTDFEAFKNDARAISAARVIDEISPEDMAFGLDRGWDAFRLFTDVDNEGKGEGGANVGAGLNSGLLTIQSNPRVVQGRIPRSELFHDAFVAMTPAMAASECPEDAFSLVVAPDAGVVAAFSNTFSLADILRRRLGLIRDEAASKLGADDDVAALARLAEAEMRGWAAQGRVYHRLATAPGGGTATFSTTITGITPDWFDIAPNQVLNVLPSRLKLVFGFPREAECVAGIRTTCPPPSSIKTATLLVANGETRFLPEGDEVGDAAKLGNDGKTLQASFQFDTWPPSGLAARGWAGSLLHLVLTKDPKGIDSKGRVLATFPMSDSPSEFYSAVVSDYQRHLANAAFGIGELQRKEEPCVGDDTTTSPRGYCIDGIERNSLVPLANELTASSGAESNTEDSWKHYLSLAQDAAARADELGRQLVDFGFQQDFRREAAQEQLGALCGSFVVPENMSFQDGLPVVSDNEQANACFGEAKYDLVFLGPLPFKDGTLNGDKLTGQALTDVRSVMCGTSTKGFCDPQKTTIRVGSLGIGASRPPVDLASCTDILEMARPGGSKEKLAEEALKPYATAHAITTALYNLKYVRGLDLTYSLDIGGKPTIASFRGHPNYPPGNVAPEDGYTPAIDPSKLWPLCEDLAPGPACDPSNNTCTDNAACINRSGSFVCSRCKGQARSFESLIGSDYPSVRTVSSRLERAIYYLGALVGNLPAGRIWIPVPAVNFAPIGGAIPATAPPAVVYGKSFYVNAGGTWAPDPAHADSDLDIAILRNGVPIPSTYAQGMPFEGTTPWNVALVNAIAANTTPGRYLAYHVPNVAVQFDGHPYTGNIAGFINQLARSTAQSPPGVALPLVAKHMACLHDAAPVLANAGNLYDLFVPKDGNPTVQGVLNPSGESHELLNLGKLVPDVSAIPDRDPSKIYAEVTNSLACAGGTSTAITPACAESNAIMPANFGGFAGQTLRYTREVTRPSWCSPAERAALFINRWTGEDVASDKQVLADALALSCLANGGFTSVEPPALPPQVDSVSDLAGLGQWIGQMGTAANAAVNALFLENVPERVVTAFRTGQIADAGVTTEGSHGAKILALRENLERIYMGWVDASSGIRQLGNALDGAAVSLELAAVDRSAQLLDIASAEASLDRDLAMSSLQLMAETGSAIGSALSAGAQGAVAGAAGGPWAAAGGFAIGALSSLFGSSDDLIVAQKSHSISQQHAGRQRNILNAQKDLSGVALELKQQQVFTALSGETADLHRGIQNSLSQIRTGTAATLATIAALEADQGQARFQAAKASGAPFMTGMDGKPVPLPVNIVLGRQYDITERRYREALERAKRLAYMARMSIEQRIGVRLSVLNEPIGPLPAPSLWADDVCSVQGIDYQALRTDAAGTTVTVQGTGGSSVVVSPSMRDTIGEFADQYIGDYVEKLKEFMEFYNIQFPFREADDRAVISLKERLLTSGGTCSVQSRNLLYFSDALNEPAVADLDPGQGGWEVHACGSTDAACLQVRQLAKASDTPSQVTIGTAPAAPTVVTPPAGLGGVSWLRTTTPALAGVTFGAPSRVESPARSVYQGAPLQGQSSYVLSWWDTSLSSTGALAGESTTYPYRVSIFDDQWQLVATTTADSTGGTWSQRRALDFVAPRNGTYFVSFEIPQDVTGVDLGIANVQLQAVTPNEQFASPYEPTGDKRFIFTSDCGGQAGAIQKAFEYRCESGTCFYELRAPFTINSTEIEGRSSSLTGLLGAGNYNHRHLSVAVNVVGSGVLDCSKKPTPACYGTAFLEYDLQHDAYDIPVIDYGGAPRCFTYGTGAVRGGKALAAERYVTSPVSSADESLISQDGILRPEFAGRPLSGGYRLRIYDTAALNWQEVEDIQLVLGYRVWSRVKKQPGN